MIGSWSCVTASWSSVPAHCSVLTDLPSSARSNCVSSVSLDSRTPPSKSCRVRRPQSGRRRLITGGLAARRYVTTWRWLSAPVPGRVGYCRWLGHQSSVCRQEVDIGSMCLSSHIHTRLYITVSWTLVDTVLLFWLLSGPGRRSLR